MPDAISPIESIWSRSGAAISRSALLSALVACLATGAAGVGLTYLATQVVGNYGWAVFVAEPIMLGFVATVIHAWKQPRTAGQCLGVAALGGILLPAVGLLFFGLEGIACILMASIIWVPLVLLGGVAGWAVQSRFRRPEMARGFPVIIRMLAAVALLPLTFGFERAVAPEAAARRVQTSIEIDAPPEAVWRALLSMPDLPAPTEWIFRAGLACPTGTRIIGSGLGARRYCDLSTGTMPELITAWDQPQRLAVDVLQTPPSMREWSPYAQAHPRHLEGYFIVLRGQFELEALPDGRTRLTGTTWYQTRVTPVAYWSCWCDYVVHAVHRRVFTNIANSALAARSARGLGRHTPPS